MRLRQIALVAAKLAPVETALCEVLGLETCYHDPQVGKWGLENALMPIGGNFLEVVAPVEADTSAGRYLERRHGDGGYMVILQCADALAERRRIQALGVRAVATADRENYRYTHFHPADTGGILLSVDSVDATADWRAERCIWAPAGDDWQTAIRTDTVRELVGAELQSEDPAAMAALWSRILGLPTATDGHGVAHIALDNADLRFVPIADGRGRGLGAIDLKAADADKLLTAAATRGMRRAERQVEIGGCRMNIV